MKLIESLLEFLFPPHCPLCANYVPHKGGWCDSCLTKALMVRRLPLDEASLKVLDGVWALGRYHEALRELILRLKYEKRRDRVPYFKTFLNASLESLPEKLLRVEIAVPVPLHEEREKERGFNQTELIFRKWVCKNGLTWQNALRRTKKTLPQFGLAAEERRINLSGVFEFSDNMDVTGKHVLLLDDIYTTGTTLRECAKVLRKAGAVSVLGLVLASDRE